MLILSRPIGSRVLLQMPDGRACWIEVVQVSRGAVRLGFTAPHDVKILREEVLRENAALERKEQP